jgi:hypothetical protein
VVGGWLVDRSAPALLYQGRDVGRLDGWQRAGHGGLAATAGDGRVTYQELVDRLRCWSGLSSAWAAWICSRWGGPNRLCEEWVFLWNFGTCTHL